MRYDIEKCLFICGLIAGCSTLKYKTEMQPNQTPRGGRVYLEIYKALPVVRDASDTATGKALQSAASEWLKDKGFSLVDQARDADSVVKIAIVEKPRRIYVKQGLGKRVGGVWVNIAPEDTQDHLGEIREVSQRSLHLEVSGQTHGAPPQRKSSGVASPEKLDDPFFESADIMASAAKRLLNDSALGGGPAAPAISPGDHPGCWWNLGIKLSNFELKNGAVIAGFEETSGAKAAGLRAGDIISKIDDETLPSEKLIQYFNTHAESEILATRNGKAITFKVSAREECAPMELQKDAVLESFFERSTDESWMTWYAQINAIVGSALSEKTKERFKGAQKDRAAKLRDLNSSTVTLLIEIDRTGAIDSVKVHSHSNFEELDQAAVDGFRELKKIPPGPERWYQNGHLTFAWKFELRR